MAQPQHHAVIESMPTDPGMANRSAEHSTEEWIEIARLDGPMDPVELAGWLSREYGFETGQAEAIAMSALSLEETVPPADTPPLPATMRNP